MIIRHIRLPIFRRMLFAALAEFFCARNLELKSAPFSSLNIYYSLVVKASIKIFFKQRTLEYNETAGALT